jgi:signal transduction histidine kinase
MADDDYTEEQKELINLINETSNNSLELINEILEVANNDSAQLNKELVEINSLISRSAELLRFKAAEKNQEIKLDLLENPEELLISREKIWRVIGNLISNAIKFSPVNGIIYVKISADKNMVKIAVKDDGIGIPENLKDKIFNMFTEAKRPGTAGEKSFGLGLSISKQIIENHEGKIWFENNDDKGTTFYIILPKLAREKATLSKN